jgi:hypothetical protein
MSRAPVLAASVAVLAAILAPACAEARTLNLQTALTNYGGKGAYLAIYLTDPTGKFHSTLHVAGSKAKYFSHLRDWTRGNAGRRIDGMTGASVGSGGTLNVSVDVADALLNAGYQIRVDSSVEHGSDNVADVIVPLGPATAGKPMAAKGYVKSFKFDM